MTKKMAPKMNRLGSSVKSLRPQPFRVDAGQPGAQPGADDDAGKHHRQHQVGAEEAAKHVLVLFDGRAEEEMLHAVLEILLHRAAHHGGHHHGAETAQQAARERQRTGRVDQELAAETDARFLEDAARGRHPQHGQRQEHGEIHPGGQQLEPLPRFEAGDGKHGCLLSRTAGRRGGAPQWWRNTGLPGRRWLPRSRRPGRRRCRRGSGCGPTAGAWK